MDKHLDLLFEQGIDLINRRIYLVGEIDEKTAGNVIKAVHMMSSSKTPGARQDIEVYIHSSGGECDSGFAIYDTLVTSPVSIVTVAQGLIASMATIVFMAGDYRLIGENCEVMVHPPSDTIIGSAPDLAIDAKQLKVVGNRLIDVYAAGTKKGANYWRRISRNKYFTAEEAIEVGLATDYLHSR